LENGGGSYTPRKVFDSRKNGEPKTQKKKLTRKEKGGMAQQLQPGE